jgi:hypothetical protein
MIWADDRGKLLSVRGVIFGGAVRAVIVAPRRHGRTRCSADVGHRKKGDAAKKDGGRFQMSSAREPVAGAANGVFLGETPHASPFPRHGYPHPQKDPRPLFAVTWCVRRLAAAALLQTNCGRPVAELPMTCETNVSCETYPPN